MIIEVGTEEYIQTPDFLIKILDAWSPFNYKEDVNLEHIS